jgi:hypothetical protein
MGSFTTRSQRSPRTQPQGQLTSSLRTSIVRRIRAEASEVTAFPCKQSSRRVRFFLTMFTMRSHAVGSFSPLP